MEVGEVECRYADGRTEKIPLIVGEQLDCTLSPYATQTTVLKMAKGRGGLSKHLSAWSIATDPTRVTEFVTVRMNSYDVSGRHIGDERSLRRQSNPALERPGYRSKEYPSGARVSFDNAVLAC